MLAVTYYVESEGSNHLDNCRFLPSGLSPIQTLKQARIANESLNNAAHFQANNPSIPHFSLTVINGLKSVGHWTMHYGMNSSSVGDVKTVAGNSRMTRRPQAMCVARAHLSFHLIWKCNAPILKANNALHTNNRNTRGSSNTHTRPGNERYHQHHLIHSVYKKNFSHIHSPVGSYVYV